MLQKLQNKQFLEALKITQTKKKNDPLTHPIFIKLYIDLDYQKHNKN